MQGKCRIYTAYTIVMIIGILLFIMFVFFIENKMNKNNINILNANQTIKQNNGQINSDLDEPIKLINSIDDTQQNKNENEQKKDVDDVYMVNVDILNIREKPNVESNIIKKYTNGDNIIITDINDKWGKLKSGGFAYMELLQKNDDPNAKIANDAGIIQYKIIAKTINIREKPNVESNILRKMSINQKIYIKRIEGQWGEVLGGGFAYMELLQKDI